MRDLIDHFLLTTHKSAIACFDYIAREDERGADQSAVKAMRVHFNKIDMRGRIVIGEGERDEAPMLYIGEEVGLKNEGIEIDIAVDPLEGTMLCSRGDAGALSVMAISERGNILHAPDVYMKKIAVGVGFENDVIDIDKSASENLKSLANAKGCEVKDLSVMILDRERHENLIKEVRALGCKVFLIRDGDVSAAIHTCFGDKRIDCYMGIGGAPEGVLAAAALKCFGGQMQCKLILDSDERITRAKKMGIEDVNRVYNIDDMISGDVIFVATGVTDGSLVDGVSKDIDGNFVTHSLLIKSIGNARDVSFIKSIHLGK